MLRHRSIATVMTCVLTATASAHTADEQLAFAEHLAAEGDDTFALLEYKRFVFHHPTHARAGDATLQVSRLLISHQSDVGAAKRVLGDFMIKHPNTQASAKAKSFLDFIEVHDGFDGQPLVLYLRARTRSSHGDHAAAAADLNQRYPQSTLVPDARYSYAVALENQHGPTEAVRAAYAQLVRDYPNTAIAQRAAERLAKAERAAT